MLLRLGSVGIAEPGAGSDPPQDLIGDALGVIPDEFRSTDFTSASIGASASVEARCRSSNEVDSTNPRSPNPLRNHGPLGSQLFQANLQFMIAAVGAMQIQAQERED